MATGAAADGIFRSVFEGCISGHDHGVERRPYHRNCNCALHRKSPKTCNEKLPRCNTVSYPMRRAWSEGSLVLAASPHSSPSSSSSSSSSPAPAAGKPQLGLVDLDEEEENNKFFCLRFE